MTAFFKSLDVCPCMSVMNSLAFMPCSFSARASVQGFSVFSPRGLVACVLVRTAMDVDTVTVMPVAATNIVPVVMITPADFLFLAVAVVVYLGGWLQVFGGPGVLIGMEWCISLLSGSVIIFTLTAEGCATQIQSAPGGIVFTVALLL